MKLRSLRIPLVLALAGVAAFLVFRFLVSPTGGGSAIRVSGNIELTEVDISFPATGRVIEVLVDEGDPVARGDTIARLDDQALVDQLELSEAALAAARSRLRQLEAAITLRDEQVAGETMRARAELGSATATLDELRAGSRPQELQTAEATAASARSELARATSDWERAQTLYADEDISTAQFDEFRTRWEVATARVREAEEQLALVREGPRREDIQRAEAGVESARANLRLAEAGNLEVMRMQEELDGRQAEIRQAEAEVQVVQTRIRDAVAVSPVDGVVLVRAAEPGEVRPAGSPVVTVGDLAHPWLRAYINETDLGRVRIGTDVSVRTDSFPGKTYRGRVSFIASEAEFTPHQIQTEEERVRLVYRIKIDLENPNGELKSNMPADAEIPLLPIN